jgi:hypothetical protein
MAGQQINPDGDVIKNVQEDSHVKGTCVPAWAEE